LDNRQFQDRFILNPEYRLRSDERRALIYYRHTISSLDPNVSNFLGFLHPLLAVLLSLFNGNKTLEETVDDFVYSTGFNKAHTLDLILPLIENKREIKVQFEEGLNFYFPINTLIPYKGLKKKSFPQYSPEQFLVPQEQLDFTTRRLYKPLDLMLHLNNVCTTKCLYCYVDMRKKVTCQIPFERIRGIIREARELGMRSFSVSGGEVFTYKYWRELLRELVANGFDPSITTKYPLNEKKVKELKDIGVRTIIFSLDTINKDHMVKLLQVKEDYHSLILKTLGLLDQYGFDIHITGQITSFNQESVGLDFFKYLTQYENVRVIHLRVPGYSMFPKGVDYTNLCPSKTSLERIESEVKQWNQNPINGVKVVLLQYQQENHYFGCSSEERQDRFLKRGQCSANIYNFQIQPDGKVSICDAFLRHSAFIIGDLMTQSIKQMWNSEKALGLYYLPRDSVSSESACKSCADFDGCHQGKGACWKLAMEAYGEDKWDWPDPRCPHAPEPDNKFWISPDC
jgi:radical SAM protein with 4Fe4S-binding SPASM domain